MPRIRSIIQWERNILGKYSFVDFICTLLAQGEKVENWERGASAKV